MFHLSVIKFFSSRWFSKLFFKPKMMLKLFFEKHNLTDWINYAPRSYLARWPKCATAHSLCAPQNLLTEPRAKSDVSHKILFMMPMSVLTSTFICPIFLTWRFVKSLQLDSVTFEAETSICEMFEACASCRAVCGQLCRQTVPDLVWTAPHCQKFWVVPLRHFTYSGFVWFWF